MNSSAFRAIALGLVAVSVVGCQSGPRFAWWKRDKAPEDTSAVARSAAPALPSAQSKPQAAAVDGLTPAAPPSSANLAAAGTPSSAISGGATTPSAATVANAPVAQYPPTAASSDLKTPAASTPTTPPMAAVSTPPIGAGPYDPNAYGASTGATSTTAASSTTPAVADRYAAATTPPSSPPNATPSTADALVSPAALAVDRYSATPTPFAASTSTPPSGDRYGQALIGTAPASNAVTAQAAVSPGQYRPGGTSTYIAPTETAPAVEVATLPAAPAVPPVQEAVPAATSVPWSPPATTTPAGGSYTR